jgi:hypothetical protein
MRIGLISDTHNFLDPQIARLFTGVEHILHAGDIGLPAILNSLADIAPVTAVSGNTDEPELGYSPTQVIELAGRKFLIHHIVSPHAPSPELRLLIEREHPEVVMFGHTHKPFSEEIENILYFNPGYAGKSRFGMERTVAIMECDQQGLRARYFRL